MITGCGPKEKPSPSPQNTSAPSQQTNQSTPDSKAEEPSEKNDEVTPKVKEETGIYNGKVDNNFIEIKLDSTGTPIEFNIMEIEDTLKEFNKNDRVKITYIVNDDKQHILKSIEKIE